MLKVDAITFFGSKTKLANAAGVRLASVAAWGILVPEGRAMRLQEASGGELLEPALAIEKQQMGQRQQLSLLWLSYRKN